MTTFTLSAAPIFLICSSLLCGWLAVHALGQRRNAFSYGYAWLMACGAIYALGYGLELASPDLPLMKAMLRVQYLALPFIPFAWLAMAWSHMDHRGLPAKGFRLLLGISSVFFLIYQTNDLHRLFYTMLDYSRQGDLAIAIIGEGVFYWLYIVYLNVGIGAGVLLFLRVWRQSKPIYRQQARCLLFGSLFPWGFHLIYQAGYSPSNLDLSPFGLAAAGLLFCIATQRHGILDILPMARDMIFDGITEGVIVLDEQNRIIDFNRSAQTFFPAITQRMLGTPLHALEGASSLTGGPQENETNELAILLEGQRKHLEIRRYAMPAQDGHGSAKVLLILDISEKKALTDQLHQLASIDELTGIFNRRYLLELSHRAVQLAQRHRQPLSVIIADVDHFKTTNDTQGHLAGDALLRRIAAVLRERLRSTDILGRYGGDEFIITLPATNSKNAADLANMLNLACQSETGTTLSLGVAELETKMGDFNNLLRAADEALYRAKTHGRNRVAIAHTPSNNTAEDGCFAPHQATATSL